MKLRSTVTAAVTIMMIAGCTQSGSRSASNGNDAEKHATTGPTGRPEPPARSDPADGRIEAADYQRIRWEPLPRYTGGKRTKAYLTFHPNGTWTGSDGCNGQVGKYTLSPDGDLTAHPGPQTLIGCLSVSVNDALKSSDHIDIEGGRLTLNDGHRVVLELTRA